MIVSYYIFGMKLIVTFVKNVLTTMYNCDMILLINEWRILWKNLVN